MSNNNLVEAQNALADQLANTPPSSADEAETFKLMTEALDFLASAEKTQSETRDATRAGTKAQRWVQFIVGIVGISGTVAGAVGTLYFWDKYRKEDADLKTREVTVTEREKIVGNKEIQYGKIEEKYTTVLRNIGFGLDIDEVLRRENERQKKSLEEIEIKLEKKAIELSETKKKVASGKLNIAGQAQTIEDRNIQADTLRSIIERLKAEIASLPQNVRDTISDESPQNSDLQEVISEAAEQPPQIENSTSTDVIAFSTEVEKLWDEKPGIRGDTYKELTTGTDRTSQALFEALLAVGEKKFTELEGIGLSDQTSGSQSNPALIERGLANLLVTIRDMSRTVTKLPVDNRNKAMALATKLNSEKYGVRDEANSLIEWLQNGNSD